MFSVQKCLQCWFKCAIIKTIQKEVTRRTMTMSKKTTYIRYYFDRGEWRMTKDRCVLRTGRGLDSAIAAEKELKAAGIPVRFMFIEGWKIYCFFRKKRLTSCPNRLYGEKGRQTKCGAFILETESQVRQIVCLAIRGKTQKSVIRQLIIMNGTLRLKLTKTNKTFKTYKD